MLRRTHWKASLLLCAVAVVVGCEADSPRLLDSGETHVMALAASRDADAPVFWMADFQLVDGASSQLVRTRNGVNYRLSKRGSSPATPTRSGS